jgi:hypothetical protein
MILHVQWTLRQDDPHPIPVRFLSDQDIPHILTPS